MNEMIKMVVVLTLLTTLSGGLLAAVKSKTELQIENQVLKFQKAPAIKDIFPDAANDPLLDRFTVKSGNLEVQVFPARFADGSRFVAFETTGSGFGGPMGLMVGINLETDTIAGVRMTTHAETPGIGTKPKDDLSFVSQFRGLGLGSAFSLQSEGGDISGISGATVTCRGLVAAANQARVLYETLKPEILSQMN